MRRAGIWGYRYGWTAVPPRDTRGTVVGNLGYQAGEVRDRDGENGVLAFPADEPKR